VPRKPTLVTVTIKVDAELAERLKRLPNKSDFIRRAIAAQVGVPCPLCQGHGAVSREVNEDFAPKIRSSRRSRAKPSKN
jgi:hypothetical protein